MCEIDLGVSSDWGLKGQGNANAVFGYSGANTSLVSHYTAAAQPSNHDTTLLKCEPKPHCGVRLDECCEFASYPNLLSCTAYTFQLTS